MQGGTRLKLESAVEAKADLDSNPAIEMSEANLRGTSTKNDKYQPNIQNDLEEIVEENGADAYATTAKKLLDGNDGDAEFAADIYVN